MSLVGQPNWMNDFFEWIEIMYLLPWNWKLYFEKKLFHAKLVFFGCYIYDFTNPDHFLMGKRIIAMHNMKRNVF